jgi:hypothetical protein
MVFFGSSVALPDTSGSFSLASGFLTDFGFPEPILILSAIFYARSGSLISILGSCVDCDEFLP